MKLWHDPIGESKKNTVILKEFSKDESVRIDKRINKAIQKAVRKEKRRWSKFMSNSDSINNYSKE